MAERTTGLKWSKSSHSADSQCVEWASDPVTADVLVRNSRRPDEIPIRFTLEEWRAFLAGAKDGEADL